MTDLQAGRLDEPVEIQDHNPACVDLFRTEARKLQSQLGKIALGIEHIGSTAVPGLRGKPVVDIMVGVESKILTEEALRLRLIEYESLGEGGVRGRLYFRKRKKEAVNVQIVEYDGMLWKDNLLLRDYLRTHPGEAERYGRAKLNIVGRGIHTLLAYSEAKTAIVAGLLEKARAWKERHNLHSGIGT